MTGLLYEGGRTVLIELTEGCFTLLPYHFILTSIITLSYPKLTLPLYTKPPLAFIPTTYHHVHSLSPSLSLHELFHINPKPLRIPRNIKLILVTNLLTPLPVHPNLLQHSVPLLNMCARVDIHLNFNVRVDILQVV